MKPKLIITELPSVLHGSAIEDIVTGKKSYANISHAMKYPNPPGTPPLVATGQLKPALDLVLPLGTEKLEVGYTNAPLIDPPVLNAAKMMEAADAFNREMEQHVYEQLMGPLAGCESVFDIGAPFIHTVKWDEQPLWPIVWQVVGEFGLCVPLPEFMLQAEIASLRDDLAAEIERRLPDEFTQNRSALAQGLLTAELECERRLMAWDRKWNR